MILNFRDVYVMMDGRDNPLNVDKYIPDSKKSIFSEELKKYETNNKYPKDEHIYTLKDFERDIYLTDNILCVPKYINPETKKWIIKFLIFYIANC